MSFGRINILVDKVDFIKPTYICLIYRPPNSSTQDTKLLCDFIRSFEGTNVVLLGNYNFCGINWSSQLASNFPNQFTATEFLNVIDDIFLY